MASLNDQFEYGRIPIKTLPYKDRDLSQCNEIIIDYGENGNYHIYITHHQDRTKYIGYMKLTKFDSTTLALKVAKASSLKGKEFILSVSDMNGDYKSSIRLEVAE